MKEIKPVLLKDYAPLSQLRGLPDNTPRRARFPVIDSHNHLWDSHSPEDRIRILDDVGVERLVNVTANTRFFWSGTGYALEPAPYAEFQQRAQENSPGRFLGFTMAAFARWGDFRLFGAGDFADEAIAGLEADARLGARGLKVTKELGLRFTDADGSLVRIDDERLDPVWRRAAELELPVLIHSADPPAFFDPVDERNEQYVALLKYPDWSFHGGPASFGDLLAQRDRLIARHRRTTFILPHVASWPENLPYVAHLLDENPNVMVDFAARIDELGRQPYRARDFFIEYQDRILFGSDMPIDAAMYRCYFRFLETRDECIRYPDYDGSWGVPRFPIHGLGLPDEVLKKIYRENARRTIPHAAAGE
ncbi:MAG: amidohydrolase family protein [Candidatus Sumerlaeota bacterium]|nr:amidohydrolase family protein [Candidatus Sumerlaeota bacterium]